MKTQRRQTGVGALDFLLSLVFLCVESGICVLVFGEGQREAGAAGQTADQAEGERKPSAHLLSDGQDVGHSGRVSHQTSLPVPGERRTFQGAAVNVLPNQEVALPYHMHYTFK